MRVPQRLLPLLAVAAVAGVAIVAPGSPDRPAGAAATTADAHASNAAVPPVLLPVKPLVRSFAVSGIDTASAASRGRRAATDPTLAALSDPEPATGFVVTGATWTGRAPAGLTLQVRTRTAGEWSAWTSMPVDADHGPDAGSAEAAGARPGTDAFVAGDVDDVQLKVNSDSGRAPAGLALSVIDPGTSTPAPASKTPAAVTASAAAADAAATNEVTASAKATPMPTIYSRAEWGADEGLRDCCVEYGEVHAGFVHHTVNANGYSRREVPAILRGIYAYHTQTRGWRDIGYNYLIDRFGRIWEGRFGGITMPVVGAHTLNYNENSFAASAIGNYETAQPSAAMLDAYARLYAWKLSLHGLRPTTRQNVAGTGFNAISGHRDAAQTACPGINLYRKIPQIIERADAYQRAFAGRSIARSVIGDAQPDVLAVDRATGRLGIARGTGAPGFGTPRTIATGFSGQDSVVVVGDLTGDERPDLLARDTSTGTTRLLKGSGAGTFAATKTTYRRWAGSDLFAAPGDVDGDGHADVVARDAESGELYLYRGRAARKFRAGVLAVRGFQGMNVVAPAGDFNRDGHPDLLTRGAEGVVRVLLGDGTGLFATKVELAKNWSGKSVLTGGLDVTGDGRPDVVARTASTRTTRVYANVDGSRLSPAVGATTAPMASMSLSQDLDGDGVRDLVATTAGGRLTVVPVLRQNWFTPALTRAAVLTGMDKVLVVGDWNGDGYADTMAHEKATGKMWLYPGRASGAPYQRIGGWGGWERRSQITAVGDFDGDGRPDLMARVKSGAVYLFPGRRADGFGKGYQVRSSLPAGALIVGVGRWTRDGAPDVMVRTPAGQLLLYPGNGPGGLDDPIALGKRFDGYDSLVGAGDVNGDRRPDLIGRDDDGDAWLLPGVAPTPAHPAGSIGRRAYLASGWNAYRLG